MFSFLRSVFSESDGTGSWSRVQGFLSLGAAITWVSLIVAKTHAIPDLTGACFFLSASNAPYAVNKFTNNGNASKLSEDKKSL